MSLTFALPLVGATTIDPATFLFVQINRTSKDNTVECHVRNDPDSPNFEHFDTLNKT